MSRAGFKHRSALAYAGCGVLFGAAFTGCDAVPGDPRLPPAERTDLRLENTSSIDARNVELIEKEWRLRGDPVLLEKLLSTLRGSGDCASRLRAEALQAESTGRRSQLVAVAKELASGASSRGPKLSAPACEALVAQVLAGLGGEAPEQASLRTPETTALANAPPQVALQAKGPLRVSRVERYGAQDSARVVVVMSEPTVYEVGQLPAEPGKGPRLFVDVEGASYEGDPQFEVGGLVSHVRVGRQDGGTRIVLDLRERVYQHIFFLPEPFRLVIDVSKSPPRGAPSPLHGARAVQRIVLDPGHGGHDPGAVGHMGLQEKDVALDVALRAAPLIARELGINTLLTRDTDQFVPLDERVAKANAFSADLFISIHCNASESAQTQGVMTFVLDESRDALAQQVAARENAASAAAGKQLATAMSQVMGADSLQRSLHFAQLLQRASLSSLSGDYPDFRDGGVRRAGFYVLAGAQMPAVLFEASFISNAEEERRLDSAGYRQKLADALVNAVRAYQAGL